MSSTFSPDRRANSELKSLYEIAQFQQQNQLQDYFLGVMGILSKYFPISYSALVLQSPQKSSLHVEALYGIGKEVHPFTCNYQKGIMGKVLESQQPMAIQNLNQEPLYEEMAKGTKRVEKIQPPLLCIPLASEGELLGVFNINPLYSSREEFAQDFRFLSILSAILSPTIKNYQKMNEPLQKSRKQKVKPPLLDEILEQKLAEVLNKIDPYVEAKNQMKLLDDIIGVVERILIKSALDRVGHVQTAAAQFLGINRNTLSKKMKELKIKFR
jgi:transcriptional regulator with GAF, ATPase, and Fis domain